MWRVDGGGCECREGRNEVLWRRGAHAGPVKAMVGCIADKGGEGEWGRRIVGREVMAWFVAKVRKFSRGEQSQPVRNRARCVS